MLPHSRVCFWLAASPTAPLSFQCALLEAYAMMFLPLSKAWKSRSYMLLWSRLWGSFYSKDFSSWSRESIWCLTNFLQEFFKPGRKQYFLSAVTWGLSVWPLSWRSFWVHMWSSSMARWLFLVTRLQTLWGLCCFLTFQGLLGKVLLGKLNVCCWISNTVFKIRDPLTLY